MGCFTGYPETTKLIYYIKRAEIVKNFTNFACGFGAVPIKFRAFIKRVRLCMVARGVW